MTEELKQKAEEYIKANNLEWELECHRTSPIGEVEQAYIAGATEATKELQEENKTLSQNLDDAMSTENALKQRLEEKDKQIEELKAQIEKMKNCKNCAN